MVRALALASLFLIMENLCHTLVRIHTAHTLKWLVNFLATRITTWSDPKRGCACRQDCGAENLLIVDVSIL